MSPKTAKCVDAIVKFAREGNEIIPAFFSWSYGQATTAAAIRAAKKRGLIEIAGLDGIGNPKYRATWAAPEPTSAVRH